MEVTIEEVKEMMFNLQVQNQKIQNQSNAMAAQIGMLTKENTELKEKLKVFEDAQKGEPECPSQSQIAQP